MRGDDFALGANAIGGDLGCAFAGVNFDAEPFERADRAGREIGRILLEYALAALKQNDPCLAWVVVAEVTTDRVTRDLGDRAGELDTRRPTADHDERQQRLAPGMVAFALGKLEGQQNATAPLQGNRQRVDR